MNQLRWYLIIGLSVGFTWTAMAQEEEEAASLPKVDYDAVEITSIPVAGSVYMLKGEGGNIGVCVGVDGVFMIDDQYAPLTEKIKEAVAGLSDQSVRFVLNTHWHGDHTGGNENLAQANATIMAHENVRKRLTTHQVVPAFGMDVPPAPEDAWPVITFDSEANLYLNGETIAIRHVAHAHTDGDSIVHFEKANVVHAGDVLFNGFYPFIDKEAGGSISGMIAALDIVLSLVDDQTKIIGGHGPLANEADVETARALLVSVQAALQPLVEQGLGVDEIVTQNPLAHLDADFGDGFLSTELFTKIAAELLMP